MGTMSKGGPWVLWEEATDPCAIQAPSMREVLAGTGRGHRCYQLARRSQRSAEKHFAGSTKKVICRLPDGKADFLLNFRANVVFRCHQQLPQKQSRPSNDVSIPFSLWAEEKFKHHLQKHKGHI